MQGGPEHVAFVVTDDGGGIPSELAARVGEPFFTTKAEGRGTGLGLAITNEIVKHHRGSLGIEPRHDTHGTRACIEIPASVTPSGTTTASTTARKHEQAPATQ